MEIKYTTHYFQVNEKEAFFQEYYSDKTDM